VMYGMVAGHSPFHGRTHAETIHKIIDLVPRRLHDIDPAVPLVLSEMVEKLLAKNPDDRYQSAFEVADVLRRLMVQLNQAPTDEIAQVLSERAKPAVAPSVPATKEQAAAVPRVVGPPCLSPWSWSSSERMRRGSTCLTAQM
jgi:serine/threonine protein kinase